MADKQIKPNKGTMVEIYKGPNILILILVGFVVAALVKALMHNKEVREVAMIVIPIIFVIVIFVLLFSNVRDDEQSFTNELYPKNFIDRIFGTEFELRKRLKNYMMIQATLVVRETSTMNWDKAIEITFETLERFKYYMTTYRGSSSRTQLLLNQYSEDLMKALLEYEYAKKVYGDTQRKYNFKF